MSSVSGGVFSLLTLAASFTQLYCLVIAATTTSTFSSTIESLSELTSNNVTVNIGIILEECSKNGEDIVELVLEDINSDENVFPGVQLSYVAAHVASNNPFAAVNSACSFLEHNISAIVSCASCQVNQALQSFSENYHLPHIVIPKDACHIPKEYSFTKSVRPDFRHESTVILDLLKIMAWKRAIVFYDKEEAYRRAESVMQMVTSNEMVLELVLIRIKVSGRELLNVSHQLHRAKEINIHNFLVFCDKESCAELLLKASYMGLTLPENYWMIVSENVDEHDIKLPNETNNIITFVKSHNFGNDYNKKREQEILYRYSLQEGNKTSNVLDPQLKVEEAYLHDAIFVLAKSLKKLGKRVELIQPELSCYPSSEDLTAVGTKNSHWKQGKAFLHSISKIDLVGLTGRINFNGSCYNINIQMNIFSLEILNSLNTIRQIGQWDPEVRLNLTRIPFTRDMDPLKKNKTYRIVTIVEAPFVMIETKTNGEVAFSGYCIDMLESIAKDLDFRYELYQVPDGKYGGVNPDGTWNGLVGQVYYGLADFALAGMIINPDREAVVDFTKPYMNYGVGIIMRRPNKRPNVFAFLEPLDGIVWGAMVGAILGIGFLLFLLDKFSPFSFNNFYSRDDEGISFSNSMWFSFASFMQQGADIVPSSYSGRILSLFWWFFALILIATYTANLAAFLTVTRMENPINSLDDLAAQTSIIYGTIENSSLHRFFQKRQTTGVYERMWNYMQHVAPSPWVESDLAGYERAKKENYAFFWDAPVLDYVVQTECDLMVVGKPFNLKGYGIAVPHKSEYRDSISLSILKLQETGILEELRKKWFERESICPDETSTNSRAGVGIETVSGVFYILIVGVGLSFIIAFCEFLVSRAMLNMRGRPLSKSASKADEIRVPTAAIPEEQPIEAEQRLHSYHD